MNKHGNIRVIHCTMKKNQIVFDPFMGSGTTGVVCVELDRNYLGSEIIESTCKIAENRISKIKNADKFLIF